MGRLGETTRCVMDDYTRMLAFRADLLLPVDDSHKGYDSAIITRFMASLRVQIVAYLQQRRRGDERVYPCKLRYAWVREFGELNGNRHYHMLLLVNRGVFRSTMLNTENPTQPHGLLVRMVARTWAVALRRIGGTANKVPFHLPGVSYELGRRNGTNTDFLRSYIYHISYLMKEYTKNHDDGERDFSYSQGQVIYYRRSDYNGGVCNITLNQRVSIAAPVFYQRKDRRIIIISNQLNTGTNLMNDELVTMAFVATFTGSTDKWFHKLISEGKFPKPIKLGRSSH